MRIHDVAKKLRVSVATVSRALNPATSGLVAEKTRRRIQRFVAEVGYVPNRTARELSTGKTRTIGLVLPNILESIFFNDYLTKILSGIYDILEKDKVYNCKIVILPKGQVLTHLDQQVLSSGIDGLLLSPYCDPALYGDKFPRSLLTSWKQPVVILNIDTSRLGRFSGVFSNHFDAARKAVTYLIQKGHRDIAMIKANDLFPEAVVRFDAYRAALEDHGLPVKKSFVSTGDFLIESGYNSTLQLLRAGGDKPTAIFCANDEMGIGAIRALKALRIRCPQDIAVMGYDGIDLGAYIEPRLSTVEQPTRRIAQAATTLLLDLIEERETGSVSRHIPSDLIIRDSA